LKRALPSFTSTFAIPTRARVPIQPCSAECRRRIGRHQLEVNEWCLELGGHVRTGLEDNIKFDKTRLARSNAELVARVADLCAAKGRHPARASEARQILQLPPARKPTAK